MYNIHIKPEGAYNELTELEKLVKSDVNAIVLGDFNADCTYFNTEYRTQFLNWHWVIDDTDDTTVKTTDCAYDRILTNFNIKNHGIDKTITEDLSDHYIVWVEI